MRVCAYAHEIMSASCRGQSLLLSRLGFSPPTTNGQTSSGVTKAKSAKAKSALLAGRLRKNETADWHCGNVQDVLDTFKDN